MLFQAKARLTDDAIELTGWHWRGRYSRRLSLSEILHADAKTNRDLVLWLADGEVVRLRLEHALRWQDALIDRLPGPNYTTNDP